MTYVGKPPPLAVHAPTLRESHRANEAPPRKLALALDREEAAELLLYEAEAKWEAARASFEDATRRAGVVQVRAARRQLRLRDRALWLARVRYFRAVVTRRSLAIAGET